jgi:hypothetical protein
MTETSTNMENTENNMKDILHERRANNTLTKDDFKDKKD